jgi:hypothetical protein
MKQSDTTFQAAINKGTDSSRLAARIQGWKTAEKFMSKNFYLDWLGPYPTGYVLNKAVHLGPNNVKGALPYLKDAWLTR